MQWQKSHHDDSTNANSESWTEKAYIFLMKINRTNPAVTAIVATIFRLANIPFISFNFRQTFYLLASCFSHSGAKFGGVNKMLVSFTE